VIRKNISFIFIPDFKNYMYMGSQSFLSLSLFILLFLQLSLSCFSQTNASSQEKVLPINNNSVKYAALAIDRGNGIYYGWSSDCISLAEAEEKALEVCQKKGGQCTIVLSFSGTGCAAYRFITGNVGMGYGWGIGKTQEEADTKAKKECAERSYGLPAPNVIFNCNSKNSGELKEIYDAHDEINKLFPEGTILDY
jgi:hypothetical protein